MNHFVRIEQRAGIFVAGNEPTVNTSAISFLRRKELRVRYARCGIFTPVVKYLASCEIIRETDGNVKFASIMYAKATEVAFENCILFICGCDFINTQKNIMLRHVSYNVL